MTSKKTGAERAAYKPAIIAKREAEMESITIGSATIDPGDLCAQGMCWIRGRDTTMVPDVTRVQRKLSGKILKIKTQWLP
jgi:hypothetical protein